MDEQVVGLKIKMEMFIPLKWGESKAMTLRRLSDVSFDNDWRYAIEEETELFDKDEL